MLGNAWVTDQVVASQEELNSIQLVSDFPNGYVTSVSSFEWFSWVVYFTILFYMVVEE
jgi:hypothetical protein